MKNTLITLFCLVLCADGSAQKKYNVLPWKSEYSVNTYLSQRMHEQFAVRRSRLQQALTSQKATLAYRDSCRNRYSQLLGKLPAKASLNVQYKGTIKQEGYRIEKVIYESVPGHHVTANLYIPDGRGKFPAVLFMCGHEDEAKATESYQKTAILFALNKFVVLVVDPVSQAERHQLTDKSGMPRTRGGTTEHTLVNAAANLVGTGTVGFQLWDNIIALDFLETVDEVDTERIGCLGNSGGGTQASYLIGYDTRIKVAAVCSYIASRERNFGLGGANDGCQHLVDEGKAMLEISDYLIMFAPNPVLILAGTYDFVDYTGTQIAHDELHDVYNSLNAIEKVGLLSVDDGHGISKPKREAAVSWFKKWLKHDTSDVREPELRTLAKEELKCTLDYHVEREFPEEVNDLERCKQLADAFRETRKSSKTLIEKVRTVLDLTSTNAAIEVEWTGRARNDNVDMHKLILRNEARVPVPALVIYPQAKITEVIVWLHGEGKHRIADSTGLVSKYISEGKALIIADISGTGELTDSPEFNDPKYYNREYRNAMLAIHAGTSLPALRTGDIDTVIDFVFENEKTKSLPVTVFATGVCVVPALHAAVLDERIEKLHVSNGITSFYDVFEKPDAKDWYSIVIPEVLKSYDLPDLEKHLGQRLVRF